MFVKKAFDKEMSKTKSHSMPTTTSVFYHMLRVNNAHLFEITGIETFPGY